MQDLTLLFLGLSERTRVEIYREVANCRRPLCVWLIHNVARAHVTVLVSAVDRGLLCGSRRFGSLEGLVSVSGLLSCCIHGGWLALCCRYTRRESVALSRYAKFGNLARSRNVIGGAMCAMQRLRPPAICDGQTNLTSACSGATTAPLPLLCSAEAMR